eukprot:scaffold30309_cov58-Attheya_sp.AAC.2
MKFLRRQKDKDTFSSVARSKESKSKKTAGDRKLGVDPSAEDRNANSTTSLEAKPGGRRYILGKKEGKDQRDQPGLKAPSSPLNDGRLVGKVIGDRAPKPAVRRRIAKAADEKKKETGDGEEDINSIGGASSGSSTYISQLSFHDAEAEAEEESLLRDPGENGDLIAALKVFKDILATLLSKYGEEHPRIGASLHNLGIVHLRSGNLSDALDAMEEAIRIRKLTLKSNHPKVVDSIAELGIILFAQKEYEDSVDILFEALDMREEEANANTSSGTKFLAKLSISKILNNIGCVQFESGNTPEAERTFEEALGVQQKILGKAKPRTRPGFLAMASTMCNLGYVYLEKERHNDAAEMFGDALRICKILLDERNKMVLSTLENLGYASYHGGNYQDCYWAYDETVKLKEKIYGSHHIAVANALQKRVVVCVKLFRYDEIKANVKRIDEIERRQRGEIKKKEKAKQVGPVEESLGNYLFSAFPEMKDTLVRGLENAGVNVPNNPLSCIGEMVEDDESVRPEDIDIPDYIIEKPHNSSKISGDKVRYA